MTESFSDPSCDAHGFQFINSFYIGINIENILYGIELLLYFETMRILLSNKGAHKKSNVFYALFSSMMLFSITVWVVTEAMFGQRVWLLNADFPGGPYAYWRTHISVWYMEWSRVQVVVLQLMTDALMESIHRCQVIWNSNRVVVVPVFLWMATLTLGALVAWINSIPGMDFQTGLSSQFSLAYWSTSVLLNTILTCMICYRVMRHGRMVERNLGHEHASLYFSVAGMVIESVLPYTLSGIIFLVTLGIGNPTFVVFLCVYIFMMCISPQLLILRVIAGGAWDCDTFYPTACSSVRFNPESTATSGTEASTVHLPDRIGRARIS